jgi:hypothetical protein
MSKSSMQYGAIVIVIWLVAAIAIADQTERYHQTSDSLHKAEAALREGDVASANKLLNESRQTLGPTNLAGNGSMAHLAFEAHVLGAAATARKGDDRRACRQLLSLAMQVREKSTVPTRLDVDPVFFGEVVLLAHTATDDLNADEREDALRQWFGSNRCMVVHPKVGTPITVNLFTFSGIGDDTEQPDYAVVYWSETTLSGPVRLYEEVVPWARYHSLSVKLVDGIPHVYLTRHHGDDGKDVVEIAKNPTTGILEAHRSRQPTKAGDSSEDKHQRGTETNANKRSIN